GIKYALALPGDYASPLRYSQLLSSRFAWALSLETIKWAFQQSCISPNRGSATFGQSSRLGLKGGTPPKCLWKTGGRPGRPPRSLMLSTDTHSKRRSWEASDNFWLCLTNRHSSG